MEVVRFLGEPGQTFMGTAYRGVAGAEHFTPPPPFVAIPAPVRPLPPAQAEKPATRPPVRRRDRDPRVTPAVIRYVGWFRAAAWTWREISELFEIEADVLRDALTPVDAPA